MRHVLVIGLILLVSAEAIGDETPIPQDTVRMEKRRRDRLEWNQRTLRGAYEKVGKKDPRWDEPARQAMDLAARMFSLVVDPQVTPAEIHKPARAAVDAGCDDPMLVYLYIRSFVGPDDPGLEEMIKRLQASASALAASRYPAIRRAVNFELAGTYTLAVENPDNAVKNEAERNFDAVLALLPESAESDERNEYWEDRWLDNLLDLIKAYRRLGIAPEKAYKRVDAPLAKIAELKVLRQLVRGNFYYGFGWEARTTAFAPNVPAGGFETFHKRVLIAQEAFQEAWKLRPDESRASEKLVDIDKSIGGDRATMELWFNRTMKADGDKYSACASKLDWLDPKWHGNVEEMVAFGRACRNTKNWRAGITLLVADAYRRAAVHMTPEDRSKYLSTPEVWTDIRSVFDEYLKHYPDNNAARSKYASMCYMAGHYPEAHAQFEILGDRLTTWYDFPNVPFVSLEMQRNIVAQAVAGKAPEKNDDGSPLGWHSVKGRYPGGTWSVYFPEKPEMRREAGLLGTKDRPKIICVSNGITYTFRAQVIMPASKAIGTKGILEAARKAIAKEHDGQVRDEHAATIANHPATEFLLDAPALQPKVLRVKISLVGDWLYEFTVLASKSDVSGPAATTFFDAFKFQQ